MSESNNEGEQEQPGYGHGEMTSAWLNAGSQVAQYEAGLAAEKRRVWIALGAAVGLIIGAVALMYFLG